MNTIIVPDTPPKRCYKCGELKPATKEYFYGNKSHRDGLSSRCKSCDNKKPRSADIRHDERMREWREKHPDYMKEYCKKYRVANRERIRESYYRWVKTPKGKALVARYNHNRRLRRQEAINDLTAEQWELILELQDGRCVACGEPFTDEQPPARDHIIPVVSGGGLTIANVQALHKSCNSQKHTQAIDYRPPEMIEYIRRPDEKN